MLCVCTGQQRRKRPAEPTSPEAGGSCTGASNVVQSKLAAWAEERKGRGAQRERHTAAAAARTAATALVCVGACNGASGKPARDMAPAQGVVLRSSADGSPSRAVLVPSKRLPSGNVAHVRSEANAVRSEQATCAVTNHMRRAAGIFGPCSGALRSARAVHHRDAHMPRSSACGATSGAARAWRRSFAHASRWAGHRWAAALVSTSSARA
jgi:hypothetical protein